MDRTEFVYLTQFGRRVATYDGADNAQAGLHFRLPWPIQSVQRLDRRLQVFDLPGAELLTRDAKKNTIDKTLTIDAYVCWRIADAAGVDRFIRKMGSVEGARSVLGQRINSELGAVVGKMELDELVSTEPGRVDDKREELRKRILDGGEQPLRKTALDEYGIEIVDVRLRRTNHPPAVRQAIFDRIMSEREKKSADYRSQGEQQAADIKSASDRKVAELRTEAEAEAVRCAARPTPRPTASAPTPPARIRNFTPSSRSSTTTSASSATTKVCCCCPRTANCSTRCSTRPTPAPTPPRPPTPAVPVGRAGLPAL